MLVQSLIYEDTPFGRVAKPFFEGNDDEFRNNRFKLIPKVQNELNSLLFIFNIDVFLFGRSLMET